MTPSIFTFARTFRCSRALHWRFSTPVTTLKSKAPQCTKYIDESHRCLLTGDNAGVPRCFHEKPAVATTMAGHAVRDVE